jgi:hypothetical protein
VASLRFPTPSAPSNLSFTSQIGEWFEFTFDENSGADEIAALAVPSVSWFWRPAGGPNPFFDIALPAMPFYATRLWAIVVDIRNSQARL